jgi:hypothetical protein
MVIAVNFGSKPTSLRLRTGRRWSVVFETHQGPQTDLAGGDQLKLAPRQAIILLAT